MTNYVHRDSDGRIYETAELLQRLPELVTNSQLSRADLQALAKKHCGGKFGRKLRRYLYLDEVDALVLDEKEVLGTLIYKTQIDNDSPVFVDGRRIRLEEAVSEERCHPIYSRSWIPNLMIHSWKDERTVIKEGIETICYLAPTDMDWNKIKYRLVADSPRKSFYFPKNNMPNWIFPWMKSTLPQHKSDMATLLKRPGYPVRSLARLELDPNILRSQSIEIFDGSTLDIYAEMGAWVLDSDAYHNLAEELGVHTLTGFQATIVFENGSYFKGALLPPALDLEPGIYGGIKWAPGCKSQASKAILASVLNSFAHYPWKPSLNRQQTDYCQAWDDLPVRARLFDPKLIAMAASGFPPYVKRFNNQLLSNVNRLFRKIDVSGFAGQVALGKCSTLGVQFQVYLNPNKHPHYKNMDGKILDAAWLANPSLPVNEDIPMVSIQLVVTKNVYDQLIVLNIDKSNHAFVANVYMAYYGDDGDGDGSTLSIEPDHLSRAIHWTQVSLFNTLQYKSKDDVASVTSQSAIDVAFSRSLKSRDIGRGDKLARRILREFPEALDLKLRQKATEYIQMSISAAKKYVGDVDNVWKELWQIIPIPIRQKLKQKMESETCIHDQIDSVSEKARALIRISIDKNTSAEKSRQSKQEFNETLSTLKMTMPDHYRTALQLLDLQQEPDLEIYGKIRRKGEELLMLALRRGLSEHQINEIDIAFQFMHRLWRQAGKNDDELHHGLSYNEVTEMIKQKLMDLMSECGSYAVYGTMLSGPVRFSDGMLGRILQLDDLSLLDELMPTFKLLNGLYLPVIHTNRLVKNDTITKAALKDLAPLPQFLQLIANDKQYVVKDIKPFRIAEWYKSSSSCQNTLAIIHLVEK